jgi:hypothetical protein
MKMRVNRVIFQTAILLATTLSLQANAKLQVPEGVNSSGGAKVIVCRNHKGSIKTVELLDLFEAKELYRLNITPLGKDFDSSIGGLDGKLAAIFKEMPMTPMDIWIKQAQGNMVLVDSELEPVDDAKSPLKPPAGCDFEQLALYYQTDAGNPTLWVNQQLWDKMDFTNRAAMLAHEVVYEISRSGGDTDSMRSRKIVGHLFSDFSIVPVLNEIPKGAKSCYAAKGDGLDNFKFAFLMYDDPTDPTNVKLQFDLIRGRLPFAKTVANSLKWPFGSYNIIMDAQSSLENFARLNLVQNFDADNKAFYFFDEPDGHYLIRCQGDKDLSTQKLH